MPVKVVLALVVRAEFTFFRDEKYHGNGRPCDGLRCDGRPLRNSVSLKRNTTTGIITTVILCSEKIINIEPLG